MAKQKGRRYPLVEVGEPNLFEGMFPHTEIPRIFFDQQVTEVIDGKKYTVDFRAVRERPIVITDTTFRDGQQARPPYTVKQIVDIYDMLAALSGPNGVIRQTEFFVYSSKDREAVDKCRERGHRYPEITGWIRADSADFPIVVKMGLKETGMLTSCSDYHIFYKLKLDRRKAFEQYTSLAKAALDAGIRPRCHLEDVTRADIDGFVVPFVQELMRISEEVPEHLRVKIRLCDTMGFGVPYPSTELPRSVPKLVLKMINEAGVPPERLEWHGHNDFHLVHGNAVAAWLYGCNQLNATFLGIGERTGNPTLEGALFAYASLKGGFNGANPLVLGDIAQYYIENVGVNIPSRTPLLGEAFTRTSAGIHAGGLFADERVYSVFDTRKFLRMPPKVAITDKSGSDGVALWVNEFLGLKGQERLKRTKLVKIMRWVAEQYENGRITSISDEEMEELVRQHFPDLYAKAIARRGEEREKRLRGC